MLKQELVDLLRHHLLAVQATRSPGGAPQAAVVGIAVSDELELCFDPAGDAPRGDIPA